MFSAQLYSKNTARNTKTGLIKAAGKYFRRCQTNREKRDIR